MKEDDAKTKWCPYRRPTDGVNVFSNCVASDCMMWEPYDHWSNERGALFYKDSDTEKRRHVIGGDCGLKSKESEACRL